MYGMSELDPLTAATATDPYPYYRRLVAERPFYRDDTLGMWVAASAQAVVEVLSSTVMLVRPASEPVPKAIVGTPLAETFARLVRMTDGPGQVTVKNGVVAALNSQDARELTATCERCATLLAKTLSADDPGALAAFVFGLPALAMACALGLCDDKASHAVAWTRDFVRATAAGGTPDQIAQGVVAIDALNAQVRSLLTEPLSDGIAAAWLGEGRKYAIEDAVIIANAIGFLFQSYDATAGLIGNTLVALGRDSALCNAVKGDVRLLQAVIEEVARYDSPVQNTRRFAAADTTVMGSSVCEGDAILVLLGAANRDPSVNPDPDRLDPARTAAHIYTFGLGAHACPGARIATTIAGASVSHLLIAGIDCQTLATPCYRPSANVRVPDFDLR
jgi:cytochrome P450